MEFSSRRHDLCSSQIEDEFQPQQQTAKRQTLMQTMITRLSSLPQLLATHFTESKMLLALFVTIFSRLL